MENPLILVVFALVGAAGAFFLLLLGLKLQAVLVKIKTLAADTLQRISALENWVKEFETDDAAAAQEDAAARSAQMSELGKRSQEIQAARKAELAQAMQESTEIIQDQGSMDKKKGKLFALLEAHPQVAEIAARQLDKQFGLAKMVGMKQADFYSMVGQLASKALAKLGAGKSEEKTAPGFYDF